MTVQTGTERPGRRERSRDQLMDAAFALMAEGRLADSSIADLAHAAGLSVGTFYNHFLTREALSDAVVAHAADRHAAFLDWVAGAEADPGRAMTLRIKASVRRAGLLPSWGRFVTRHALQSPALRRSLAGGAPLPTASPLPLAPAEFEAAAAAILVGMLALVDERQSDGQAEGEAAARAILILAGVEPGRAATLARATHLPDQKG